MFPSRLCWSSLLWPVGACCLSNQAPDWKDPGILRVEAGDHYAVDLSAYVVDDAPKGVLVVPVGRNDFGARIEGNRLIVEPPTGTLGVKEMPIEITDGCGEGLATRVVIEIVTPTAPRD